MTLRQGTFGPITITLVFLLKLSVILRSVLLAPVGLTRKARPEFPLSVLVSFIVLWKGLQQSDVHPMSQVRTWALMRFVVLSVLWTVPMWLLTTLSGVIILVLVLVRESVRPISILTAGLPMMRFAVLMRLLRLRAANGLSVMLATMLSVGNLCPRVCIVCRVRFLGP